MLAGRWEKQKGHIQTAYQSTEEATASACAVSRFPFNTLEYFTFMTPVRHPEPELLKILLSVYD